MLLVSWGCRISAYTSSRKKKETDRPHATLGSRWHEHTQALARSHQFLAERVTTLVLLSTDTWHSPLCPSAVAAIIPTRGSTAHMPIAAGTRLGVYEFIAPIGAGGMGEVYRARDTRLGRDVALKILPDAFAHDPERLARFKREAQVLASLNHPHIAGIYGLEEGFGISALALELVDGPTLAERLAQGPVPLAEALGIARQLADALDVAHTQGIIHRDLKPANIKMRPDGTVKVLDFGLAKSVDSADVRRGALTDNHGAITLWHHSRNRRLHGSGAGARQGRRQARRYLGVRVRGVRDAQRRLAFCGRDDDRHARGRCGARSRLVTPADRHASRFAHAAQIGARERS